MVCDSEPKRSADTIKFLCSYGGKILPRPVDGKLRYIGGLTRILAVDRSISFTELIIKLEEFCGYSMQLKCQLPNGNLEMLISIKSDEELALLIEEYDRCCPGAKIRAFSPLQSLSKRSLLLHQLLQVSISIQSNRLLCLRLSTIWKLFTGDQISHRRL
ncbi:hypothetical protein GH714_019687 [Hevea brasiliensis]|uniref:PB1 domain-containing protein n=1 Tax=Hevea brasiliensis TaxID=3981 RepID=A0A6A6N5N0_HEVBR|nr:hypothetical protein GH714_019687 [Hevea brasiliensis]